MKNLIDVVVADGHFKTLAKAYRAYIPSQDSTWLSGKAVQTN